MICAAIRAGGIPGQTFPAATTAFTYASGTPTTGPSTGCAPVGADAAGPKVACREYQAAYRSTVSTYALALSGMPPAAMT